jgi:CBS-domain-containing membrane protein
VRLRSALHANGIWAASFFSAAFPSRASRLIGPSAQVRRLPVTDDGGCLLGILSLNDLALEAERGRASKLHEIEPAEVALTLSAVCRRPFPTVVVGV